MKWLMNWLIFSLYAKDPRIVISPNSVTKIERQNITFECNVEKIAQSTVTWWNGSTQIDTSGNRYKVTQSSAIGITVTLTIINVIRSDEGVYRCKAQNDVSNPSFLTVNCKFVFCWFDICTTKLNTNQNVVENVRVCV